MANYNHGSSKARLLTAANHTCQVVAHITERFDGASFCSIIKMPGSSRLPVSLRDTFNAHRATPKGQLAVLNLEV